MPKVRKSRGEIADERFNKLMRRRIHGSRYETIAAVGDKVGITGKHLGPKLRSPGKMSVRELRELYGLGLIDAPDVVELVTLKIRQEDEDNENA
jgi:hypothetical protein